MVIDSSAVIAILLEEPEARPFAAAIAGDPVRIMSAVSAFEATVVIEARKGEVGGREFDLLLHRTRIDLVPFRREHLDLTRWAWRRYGKGRHPAGLNLGDCFAYALAKSLGEPLLFKGNDFTRTDIQSCF